MMDKVEILDSIIKILERKYVQSSKSAKDRIEDTQGMEGRNQSRYDTMRVESSLVARGLSRREGQLAQELSRAKNYRFSDLGDYVHLGSLVELEKNSVASHYLFLPFASGTKIEYENNSIMVLSAETPIAKSFFGKRTGEVVKVGDFVKTGPREYRIKNIA